MWPNATPRNNRITSYNVCYTKLLRINPEKCKDAKYDLAKKFSDWMASPKIQKFIADFKLLDKQLFTPNAKK